MENLNVVVYENNEKIPYKSLMMEDMIFQRTKEHKLKIIKSRYVITDVEQAKYIHALIQVFDSGHEENLGLYSEPEFAEENKELEEKKCNMNCEYLVRPMRIIK